LHRPHPALPRVLSLTQAILLGLGSILGTGVFVSLAIAAGVAGVWMLPALVIACGLAVCNGLSSAALASAHPVNGGSYEYGYRYLHPAAGFTAGWVFLLAKTASAATAAVGGAAYLLTWLGYPPQWRTAVALSLAALMTFTVLGGMRRSAGINAAIVSITLLALIALVITGAGHAVNSPMSILLAHQEFSLSSLLHATALLFVAYTGYARIATLGEEVRDPAHNIPRAIVWSLAISGILYFSVAAVSIGAVGPERFAASIGGDAAPLAEMAKSFQLPVLPALVSLGAISAMLGVLLNLLLGLSRMVLAMARRGDLPSLFARLSSSGDNPVWAVVGVGLMILVLVAVGSIETAWSFSAFNVLVYYAITNAAASRLPNLTGPKRAAARVGLLACVGLAFYVEPPIWLSGLSLIALGLLWHWLRRRQEWDVSPQR
jgi:APA family basic amino acid/polyamine antiporter